MAFHITHRNGNMDDPQGVSYFSALLAELEEDPEDEEHRAVSVSHESEWSLSAYRGGYIIFEHLEDGGEKHMRGVSNEQIIQLWTLLANGDIESVEKASWQPGY